jgi:tRNA (guanine37-N1)-methyltransferase
MKLKEALKNVLSERELRLLVRAYDVVGDIAITIIPPELEAKEGLIGAAILTQQKNIKVVAKRNGIYSGEFRTIPLKIIAGENRKETEHKEYGVRLCLNPEKVYFSVRSGTERKRLASLVQPDEDVLVMFSGIGAMPLVIAHNSPAGTIVGIEKNLIAHAYAVRNLALNKKIRNVIFLAGDVLDVMPTLVRKFDRVAMPLPQTGALFLATALGALKPGGLLHFYDFQPAENFADAVEKIKRACDTNNRRFSHMQTVVCGHCSPRMYRICVDGKIE